ncbi:MAG TPA: hypothetical protein EYH07_02050 [Kiloniellaceae bacterium]|nr:hypothetical protein [Kiloniellaceae bacterium]
MTDRHTPHSKLHILAAAGVVAALSSAPATANEVPMADAIESPAAQTLAGETLAFKVMRDGAQIGHHKIRLEEIGDELHVEVDIELEVSLAFITLFRYEHTNKEVWRDGRLVSLETRTNDDGSEYWVSARSSAEGLVVEGSGGSFVAPAEILPTSYWNPATVEQDVLLDTQRGRLLEVSSKAKGAETIQTPERTVDARRFKLDGDLKADLWYAPDGEWMKIAFDVRGSTIDYVPVGPHPGLRAANQSSQR